ncbi:hypothetical protein [Paenibacillus chitinolyticus]|uniref:hypothetical protein n=1 Tax=Paenibacillus chitinolyticus TaxID=79263 RepID=UPI003CFCB094
MGPLTILGAVSASMGLVQIMFPKFILKLKPLGIKNSEQIKQGGYITLPLGVIVIIFDSIVIK